LLNAIIHSLIPRFLSAVFTPHLHLKFAQADAYNSQAKADMRAQLTNADGSMIVNMNNIDAFVSNLVVGFFYGRSNKIVFWL